MDTVGKQLEILVIDWLWMKDDLDFTNLRSRQKYCSCLFEKTLKAKS